MIAIRRRKARTEAAIEKAAMEDPGTQTYMPTLMITHSCTRLGGGGEVIVEPKEFGLELEPKIFRVTQ